jgi:hypothetical protein
VEDELDIRVAWTWTGRLAWEQATQVSVLEALRAAMAVVARRSCRLMVPLPLPLLPIMRPSSFLPPSSRLFHLLPCTR